MFASFAKYCISNGAVITPLETDSSASAHLGLCNPSVLDDGGTLRLIIRNVNFALWCCDDPHRFTSPYGPLCYMTKKDDGFLRTRNFLCELSDNTLNYKLIDTTKNDYEPVFEMAGHEDMRLVRWNGKLYGTGVQRDYEENGRGRMHLSELDETTAMEVSRTRIKAPGDDGTYCEKNWMPVLDMPYHYVKWCNPFVLVEADPSSGDCRVVLEKEVPQDTENLCFDQTDIRGSSQVVPWGDYRIALVHRCRLWFNEKGQKSDTDYFTQFVVWDREWNVVRMSEPFKFARFGIEFTNGLAYSDGRFLIPFALQDNMCFLLDVSEGVVHDFIFNGGTGFGTMGLEGCGLLDFFNDTTDSQSCMRFGMEFYKKGHFAAAFVCLRRACEYNTFRTRDELYECIYWCGMSLSRIGDMDAYEKSLWLRMIDTDPFRSEGYLMLSKYFMSRGFDADAYTFANIARVKNNYAFIGEKYGKMIYAESLYGTERYEESESILGSIVSSDGVPVEWKDEAVRFMNMINNNKSNRYRVL